MRRESQEESIQRRDITKENPTKSQKVRTKRESKPSARINKIWPQQKYLIC
jgi:hypothetical protein